MECDYYKSCKQTAIAAVVSPYYQVSGIFTPKKWPVCAGHLPEVETAIAGVMKDKWYLETLAPCKRVEEPW